MQPTPGVTAEPTVRPLTERETRETARFLLASSTIDLIAYDEQGQKLERSIIDILSKEFVGFQLQFLNSGRVFPDIEMISTAQVGDKEYDLTDSTQLIIASSLLDGMIRNQTNRRNFYPEGLDNRALSIYQSEVPQLSRYIALDIEGTAPVTNLSVLHSLYQTLDTLQRHGRTTPNLGIITGQQGTAEYRTESGEIVFSMPRQVRDETLDYNNWARALGAFYRAENPQLLGEYAQNLNNSIARNKQGIRQPHYTLIVDRPLAQHMDEDFEASVAYYLDEGYEFRRTIDYLRFRGFNAEAEVWQTRYDILRNHFGFETSAHGKEYTPPQIKVGSYYQIVDFLPELGDRIFGRRDPILDADTINMAIYGPSFYLRDGDLVQVVGPVEYAADDVDRLLYPFVPVTPVTETVVGSTTLYSTTPTKENTGYIKGTDWLVPVS